MAKIRKRDNNYQTSNKVAWKFDVRMLDTLLKYSVAEEVKMPELNRLHRLMNSLDMDAYKYNQDIFNRVVFLQLLLNAKCDEMLIDQSAIQMWILDHDGELAELVNTFNWSSHQLQLPDIRMISKSIVEKLQYHSLMANKQAIMECYEKLEMAEFYSLSSEVDKLRKILSALLIDLQSTNISNGLIRELSFTDPSIEDAMDIIVNKYHRPSAVLYTGIRQLNATLSPGFQAGRLYTFIGNSGGFKSGMLLNIADQIRQFNPQMLQEKTSHRKVILFVTMENTIEETIERLYDMYAPMDTCLSYAKNGNQVLELLHRVGHYASEEEQGIDIVFRYHPNMEISTQDLYNIVQELQDQGKDVICLILDYLKRIDSPKDSGGDERVRLGFVSQELKTFAEFYEIPVITAMQTNREGNSIIDAAMAEEKTDLARFIGSSNIGSSWTIVEESDWVGIINREMRKSDQQLFLTIKRVKIRGKSDPEVSGYFNHPFVDSRYIRLDTDVDCPMSKSIVSLSADLESFNEKEETKTQERPRINSIKSSRDVLKETGLSNLMPNR